VEGSNPLPSGAPVHIWPEETSRGSQIKIRFLEYRTKGFLETLRQFSSSCKMHRTKCVVKMDGLRFR
jgi:hypothetical protein